MAATGFQVGDVILGKYEVTQILGEGGMGVVLAARHRELDELVALKFLLPALRDNAEVCARFAREAKTGIRIKNEHVARVLDVSTLPDGSAFMVMEHLVGEDLATMLSRRGALPAAEAVDLLLQACEAIAEAHTLGVVHRDLKPANLFITTGSDGLPFVKVLDFGISKSVDLESVSVTATSAVLGSPLYMSPEQLASSRDVDRRSDLWSLGVILYEMVCGAPPFHGTSFPTLCAAILAGRFVPAGTMRPGLPAPLDAVLAEALTLDREARLSSIEVLATRIAPFGSETATQSSSRIRRIAARSPSVVPSGRVSQVPASAFDATMPHDASSPGPLEASSSPGSLAVPSSPSVEGGSSERLLPGTVAGLSRSTPKLARDGRAGSSGAALGGTVAVACLIGCAVWWSVTRPGEPPGVRVVPPPRPLALGGTSELISASPDEPTSNRAPPPVAATSSPTAPTDSLRTAPSASAMPSSSATRLPPPVDLFDTQK